MPRGTRATGYGAAGGRRDTAARSAKQVSRRARRETDPRVKVAMEETRKAQEALEARLAEEAVNPAIGLAEGALLKEKLKQAQITEAEVSAAVDAEESEPEATCNCKHTKVAGCDHDDYVLIKKYVPFDIDSVPAKQEGTGWVLGSARQMLIKGHSLSHVVEATGWGKEWFSDIPVDEDGYGLGTDAWLESLDKKEKGGLSK